MPTWTPRGAIAALVTGLAVIGLIIALRQTSGLPSPLLLGLLVVSIVAAPVSRSYSRRILLGITIVLGWLPLVWWLPLPVDFDRAGMAAAIFIGGVAALIAFSAGAGMGSLIPPVRAGDIAPVAAGAIATWIYLPFLVTKTEESALNVLIKSGWDHVAHFYMAKLIASSDSVISTFQKSPDGSMWPGATYPKHFHMLVDTFIGILAPHAGPVSVTPSTYSTGTAVVLVFAVTGIAAGVAQIPWLAHRLWLTLPLVGFAIGGFLFGPGVEAFSAGYPNFIFGCAAAGLCIFVAAGMARVTQPVHAFALAGALAATAHSWILLLAMAGAAILAVLFPIRLRWRASRATLILTLVAVASAVVGVASALVIVAPDAKASTSLIGAAQEFAVVQLVTCLTISAAVIVFELRRRPRLVSSGTRVIAIGLIPAVGAVLLAVIGTQQIMQTGTILYYFTKLATGTLLVVSCALPVLLAGASRRLPLNPAVARRKAIVAATIATTFLSLQGFGYAGPPLPGVSAVFPTSSGMSYRAAARGVGNDLASQETTSIVRAAEISASLPLGSTLYLAVYDNDPIPHLANQWQLALAGTWTVKSDLPNTLIDDFNPARLTAEVTEILEAEPQLSVIVAPEVKEQLDSQLAPDLSARLLSW